ncbi:adenylate kinase family protein [Alienimonas chondri]|uniref:Adenylate kinase n=1 Tax=Alienimonas chondri TaxID=2681879 RepID=A0ABX1VD74_9PLAN|nr:nucleoside monophosphate kinase [Alienimonas chondri]NNJ25654.1 adenylate kinase [Alienimonas chondri]
MPDAPARHGERHRATDRRRFPAALLFGAPGVGKGTQGSILARIPGFFHLSSGDIFRSIDLGGEDGREITRHISRGDLVPDELTVKIWRRALDAHMFLSSFKPREDLLILDGIPRNVHQAQMLQEHVEVKALIHLECTDTEAMVTRLRRRALREGRMDDASEDIIRHRYEVYSRATAPVSEFYDPSVIHRLDAIGSPAAILRRVLDVLVPIQDAVFAAPEAAAEGETPAPGA